MYNKTLSDLEIIDSEIELLKFNLNCYNEESESLKCNVYEEGIPPNFGNEFNSKTENIVIAKENIPFRIKKLEIKRKQLETNKVIVDAKLKLLNNHELFIKRKKFIENVRFRREIRRAYENQFNTYMSNTSLSRMIRVCYKKMSEYDS